MARRISDKSKQILHMGEGKGKDCFLNVHYYPIT